MKLYKCSLLVITIAVVGSCILLPTKFTPRYDIKPLSELRLRSHIDSLENIPKEHVADVVVSNGILRYDIARGHAYGSIGQRARDDIKDDFDVKYGDFTYRFVLYYNESSAKQHACDKYPWERIYDWREFENISYVIFYTERGHSDFFGCYRPVGNYYSYGRFRSGNLIVHFGVGNSTLRKVDLTDCIKTLTEMLNQHVKVPNKPAQEGRCKKPPQPLA